MAAYIEMNGAMQFLIVDPVGPNVEAMKLNLKKMGYRNFSVTPTAFDALNLIRAGKIEFILCRLNLGDVSGTDFMEELKNDLSIPRIPFMMFSEHMDEGDLALLTELGVDAHLTIPFVTKDLAGKVMTTWSRYIDPSNPEFHYEIARRAFLSGKTQEAADGFFKIAMAQKLVSRAMVAHGRAIAKLGRVEDALVIANRVRKDFPKFVHGHQFAGELLVDAKKDFEALECFFTAISLSPKNPYRYQAITEILLRMGRFPETEQVLKKAVEANIDLPFVAENMAQALIKQDKMQEALPWYQKLVAIDNKNSGYHNNIAVCYKKLGNMEKALTHYQAAVDAAPKDARVRFNLALVYLDMDNKKSAINTLKETLGVDKNHEKAKYKLMELTDPKAFAIESAKRKAAEDKLKQEAAAKQAKIDALAKAAAEKERQQALDLAKDGIASSPEAEIKPQPVVESERPTLSKEDEERLGVLIAKLIKAQTSTQVSTLKPVVIAEEVQAKISSLKGANLRFHYGTAAMTIRKQMFKLMNEWFTSLNVISEELAVDIGDIIQGILLGKNVDISAIAGSGQDADRTRQMIKIAESAAATDSVLQDELMPIIMDLQFQDYLRQSLGALQKTTRISYDEIDSTKAFAGMLKCLVTVEDKLALNVAFGLEPDPGTVSGMGEDAKGPGDNLFFDEPDETESKPVEAKASEDKKIEPMVAEVKKADEPLPDATSGDVMLF
jgi:tetratricopeptide (TPR) repeat protein